MVSQRKPSVTYASFQNSAINAINTSFLKKRVQIESILTLKKGIWLYFFLLIFEGAVRKWILPALATPFLIIRDPVALFLLITAWKHNLIPSTIYLKSMVIIGVLSIFTAIFGFGNVGVTLYGARILLLHYPIIFVIGRVFDRKDVVKMGKVILLISIFMAVLIALQFYSPQSAWVNRAAGGIEGAGFSGSLGYYRPPGTFSFANGNVLFFSLAAPFIFYFWFHQKKMNLILLITATLALLAAIPLSISRSLFFSVALTGLFMVFSVLQKPEYVGKVFLSLIAIAVVFIILSQLSFIKTPMEAFTTRFENANETEGGLKGVIGDRYLGGLIGALGSSSKTPFFGYGIGSGSTAGLALLGAGSIVRGVTEGEWGKWIYEVGPLLGLSVILIRLFLSLKITAACYYRMKEGDVLPWLLLSVGFLILSQGEWSQPTALGFNVIIGGSILASLNSTKNNKGIQVRKSFNHLTK